MIDTSNHPFQSTYDPGLISLIYAPRARNDTLALSTEFGKTEFTEQRHDTTIRKAIEKKISDLKRQERTIAEFLLAYSGEIQESSWTLGLTEMISSDSPVTKKVEVPYRTFPFINHLDLLASPEEGLFFDPDDYVER